MAYDFRNENNYGGFNPNESAGSANQRNGYTNSYNGGSSPYGSGGYYEINKRTESIVLFSDVSVMLKCAFVNDSLSITICPPSVDPSTGKTKYQKDNYVSTLLKPERITAFCEALDKHLEYVQRGEFHNCGVWTNKDHSTMLGIVSDQDGDGIVLYTGITQASGGLPTKVVRYDFHEEPYLMENYNPMTGEGNAITVKAQLYLFLKLMNAAADVAFCGSAHEIRNGARYELNKIESDMKAIMERIGAVSQDNRSSQGYSRQASNGYYESNNYAKNETTNIASGTPIATEVVTLDDIPF